MTAFGRDRPSAPYWEDQTAQYTEEMHGSRAEYHDNRLLTASRLLDQTGLRDARIVDFGCGDGAYAAHLAGEGHTVHGTDIAENMIRIAKDSASPRTSFEVGDAHTLAEAGPCDILIALNVLAYLTDDEHEAFWDAARRIARWVLVSHSNELFDLYALNHGTVGFYDRHFDTDVTGLLTSGPSDLPAYNVRANPLSYPAELRARGFEEHARAFFNLHPKPPALVGSYPDDGRVTDPAVIAAVEPWKQMLQCSQYFSLAVRSPRSD